MKKEPSPPGGGLMMQNATHFWPYEKDISILNRQKGLFCDNKIGDLIQARFREREGKKNFPTTELQLPAKDKRLSDLRRIGVVERG